MWINNNPWNPQATCLEKYFAELIIQRCDYNEIISNKHRTINGFIQVKELIKLCELSQKRDKNTRTLIVLIEESRSTCISQNIIDDFIFNKYFEDIVLFIKNYQINLLSDDKKANLSGIKHLFHELKKFEHQLDNHYYSLLLQEIYNVDFRNERHFQRNADILTKLIDILIPTLVFNGYSISSISEVMIRTLIIGFRPTPQKFLSYFKFEKKKYHFILNLKDPNQESRDFVSLLQQNYNIIQEMYGKDMDSGFVDRYSIKESDLIIRFEHDAIDPHSHIRTSYDRLLKKILVHKERSSLSAFNDFFNHCYWYGSKKDIRFSKKNIRFKKINIDSDPINVNGRESTLRKTLIFSSNEYNYNFSAEDLLPFPKSETLQKALYYYNIALGSKSIENSLSLLWTTLETILPYKFNSSDIESIQNFVAKTLCIGSLSRNIVSFASRFIQTNKLNNGELTPLGSRNAASIFTFKGQNDWFRWLSDSSGNDTRLTVLKRYSELLAHNYVSIAKPICENNLDYILTRIKRSEHSIRFQLQRIYLHRNQIVHSGDLVNEYTNLWIHLEWYVGKLLSFALIKQEFLKTGENIGDIFRQTESDFDYITSYMAKNADKKIIESDRIISMLFQHTWQSY